jgi:hypothetical protein
MFVLNGKSLPLDTPFTIGEGDAAIQYPANFLRLSTAEEKDALGIVEQPEPENYDQRFYWGVGNPKDLTQVKTQLTAQIKATAFAMLSPTDYKITRKAETGEAVDSATLQKRAAIRTACESNLTAVNAASSVDVLAALQFTWPSENN